MAATAAPRRIDLPAVRSELPALAHSIYLNTGGLGPVPRAATAEAVRLVRLIGEYGNDTPSVQEELSAGAARAREALGRMFGPLLAVDWRKHRRPLDQKCYVDEGFYFHGEEKRHPYRAADETGPVVDVLFREHRDTEPAIAYFRQAQARAARRPAQVIGDRHRDRHVIGPAPGG
jgi:DDE domain